MICRVSVLVVVLGLVSAAQADDPIKIKAIRFDDFMRHSLAVSIPISLPVPAEYEAADLPGAGFGQHYWMRPSDVAEASRTGDLPSRNGYMSGKLSGDVAYDKNKDLFVGVEDPASLQRMRATLQVTVERLRASAYPVLLLTFTDPRSYKRAYAMYVATNIETNVVYVAFRPPANSSEIGDFVWEALRRNVKESN